MHNPLKKGQTRRHWFEAFFKRNPKKTIILRFCKIHLEFLTATKRLFSCVLNGHISHLSLPLTPFCRNGTILLNSTHALQPMDVAVFQALKNSCRNKVHDWRTVNIAQKLRKEDFDLILEECIQKTLKT